jgi:hypothetical protein
MSAVPSERRALVIAIGGYEDPKLQRLRAPTADAEGLAAVLGDPEIGNFQVEVVLDQDERELRRRIFEFFDKCRRNDVLLMHLSCHGIKDDHGNLFLAGSDTKIDALGATAIDTTWLNEQMYRSPSRRKLLLLDCCFSGRFPFGARARGRGSVDVQDYFEGRGSALITASSAMEYAYEGDQLSGARQPSFFTDAVIEALETGKADRDQDQRISVDELYEYVFDRVRESTPSQSPNKKIDLEGPLYVARSRYRAPVVAAKLDDSILEAMESPLRRVREGAVAELAALTSSSRAGVALAARQALEQMVDDDSRQVSALAQAALKTDVREPAAPPSEKLDPPHAPETASKEREQSLSEPAAPPEELDRPPQPEAASKERLAPPSQPEARSKGKPKPPHGAEAGSKERLKAPEPEARSGELATKRRTSIRRRFAVGGGTAATLVVVVLIALLANGSDHKASSGSQQQDGGAGGGPTSTQGQGQGQAVIARQQGKTQILVTATGLEPSTQNTAYQVWLSNSEHDRRSLGATTTDEQGALQAGAELPANFEDYEFIDLTSVTVRGQGENQSFEDGPTVLRGRMELRDESVTRGRGENRIALLGDIRMRRLPE